MGGREGIFCSPGLADAAQFVLPTSGPADLFLYVPVLAFVTDQFSLSCLRGTVCPKMPLCQEPPTHQFPVFTCSPSAWCQCLHLGANSQDRTPPEQGIRQNFFGGGSSPLLRRCPHPVLSCRIHSNAAHPRGESQRLPPTERLQVAAHY